MSHARIMPSAAGRWVHCPGSVTMEEQFPDLNEDDGLEGEASHWAGAAMLGGEVFPGVGGKAPNGVIFAEEIIQGAEVYYQAARDQLAGHAHEFQLVDLLHIEERVQIPRVHTECWGTPDLWYYLPECREVHVWDYKFGWGIVEAYENWQLMCYAAGVIDVIRGNTPLGVFDQGLTVVFHIVQPRPYHAAGPIREWRVDAAGIFRGHVNRLNAAAHAALGSDPQCISGKHCHNCSARHACPAAQKMALGSYEYVQKAIPDVLSPEAMGLEIRMLRRAAEAAKDRLTGLEAHAEAIIQSGGFVPGWSLDRGRGSEVWERPAQEVFALGDLFKIDLRKSEAPIAPGQARKAGIPAELVSAYSKKTPGAPKLIQNDKTLASLVFRQRS